MTRIGITTELPYSIAMRILDCLRNAFVVDCKTAILYLLLPILSSATIAFGTNQPRRVRLLICAVIITLIIILYFELKPSLRYDVDAPKKRLHQGWGLQLVSAMFSIIGVLLYFHVRSILIVISIALFGIIFAIMFSFNYFK